MVIVAPRSRPARLLPYIAAGAALGVAVREVSASMWPNRAAPPPWRRLPVDPVEDIGGDQITQVDAALLQEASQGRVALVGKAQAASFDAAPLSIR